MELTTALMTARHNKADQVHMLQVAVDESASLQEFSTTLITTLLNLVDVVHGVDHFLERLTDDWDLDIIVREMAIENEAGE